MSNAIPGAVPAGKQIIDTHTHIFPDDLANRAVSEVCSTHVIPSYNSGTVTALREQMKRCGVSRSCILGVATKPAQVRIINEFLSRTACQFTELIPIGTVYPGSTSGEETLDMIKEFSLKGFKLHAYYQDFKINDPKLDDMYAALEEAGLPVIFHAGYEIKGEFENCGSRPQEFIELKKRFKKLNIVLAHLGGNLMHDLVEKELTRLDVYFDTAYIAEYISSEQFKRIVNKHGAEKVLFASDSPWGDMKKHIDLVNDSGLNSAQKDMIFSKNAGYLYNI